MKEKLKMPYRLATAIVVGLLLIATAASAEAEDLSRPSGTELGPEFAELLQIIEKAESSIRLHALERGVRARVEQWEEGGKTSKGYDEITLDGGFRLREVRSNRESRVRDGRLCETKAALKWVCSDFSSELKILPITISEHVYDFKERSGECGAQTCLFVEIQEFGYIEYERELDEFDIAIGMTSTKVRSHVEDPQHARLVFQMVIEEKGFRPVSVRRERYVATQLVEWSTWEFDYKTPVPEIILPNSFEESD